MNKIIFIQRFTSGHRIANGKFSLFSLIWYRGGLTLKLAEENLIILFLGNILWKVSFSKIESIQIKPHVLGASLRITSSDKKGFLIMIDNLNAFLDAIKALNLPVQYDKNAVEKEIKRYKMASNPKVLIIAICVGGIFICLLLYRLLYPTLPFLLSK